MTKSMCLRRPTTAWRCIALSCALTLANLASAQSLSHGPDALMHDGFEGVAAGPFTDADAARFLTQATFGPTDADIAHLRAIGYNAWLDEQFAATPTYEMDYLNWVGGTLGENVGQGNRQEAWFLGALGGPDPQNNTIIHTDQLRQRVAFALSEIFVVSQENTTLDLYASRGLAYYYDILTRNAFGNYRQLLEQVTLSPAMGVYLNMMGNRRADLSQNQHPDENYAREINQLFSIGLVTLNIDGSTQLVAGKPVPTYQQNAITNFAHVLTGWNWSDCDNNGNDNFVSCGPDLNTGSNFLSPMVAYDVAGHPKASSPSYHDNGMDPVNDVPNKQLLQYAGAVNGGVLANGGTAASDLTFALDNIFNHPNVGPFISKQLIQRLVTSNPTPAYVQRVATVFNNNGSNVRGDLKAVTKAILLDPEARYGQWHNESTFGKLREPLLALTHLWRAMGAQHVCGQNVSGNFYDNPYRYAGYNTAWSTNGSQYSGIDQASLDAPTVFNFFKPGYVPPGEMTTLGLLGPEFQINTDSVIATGANTFKGFYIAYDVADTCTGESQPFGDVMINHAQDFALAGSANGGTNDPADRLVNAYNLRFMAGQMSPFMQQTLRSYLDPISASTWGADWKTQRINRALYLIITSPEYMIQQ